MIYRSIAILKKNDMENKGILLNMVWWMNMNKISICQQDDLEQKEIIQREFY
jgi:hypothetical protein